MSQADYRELVEELIEDQRVLTLSTTDGEQPWVAPVEFMHDEAYDFYFFSPENTRHARHIAQNETVALAIFGSMDDQPEYSPDLDTTLRGVQMRARAARLEEEQHTEAVEAAIEALEPPMPPYAAYRVEPERVYVPVIEDGVNKRVEVDWNR